ncbi:hypothetical protein BG011_008174 [Mortierella polycephala]|uniref:G-protein coupled receptors family 3 profile domain-containing protein n=1 Tax=Mortierella polycephala TaxID=41804 RepID=A0A9P6QAV7_9FUNG|nr:hypothetical protein BG011_008174 [Mortierella polycephala]
MWEPVLNSLRVGVLLPFSVEAQYQVALVVRKSLTVLGVMGDVASDLTRYEALITSSVSIPQCSFGSRREYFVSRAMEEGIYVLMYESVTSSDIQRDPTFQVLQDKLRSVESRIQVLLATGPLQDTILREMRNASFFSPDFAWITVNYLSQQFRHEPDVHDYDGLIIIDNAWNLTSYGPFDSFQHQWMQLNSTEYPGAGDPVLDNNEAMAYSCVMMLAHAYGNYIRSSIQNGTQFAPGDKLYEDVISGHHPGVVRVPTYFEKTPYRGPSGPILLDANGDRNTAYYNIMSLQNGIDVPFAVSVGPNYTELQRPPFKDGYRLPRDAPPWAMKNPSWQNANGIIYGIFCILGIICTLITAFLVFYYRKNIVIKASSPLFCLCELLGILLMYIWCTLFVGVPTRASCMAQDIILPVCVTLLAGSMTIKNYRIYRIFNSITIANEGFQTRRLLRFVALAVILSALPMLFKLGFDPPKSKVLNIGALQWGRCGTRDSSMWWAFTAAAVPVILLLFGVFLAFKTRDVVFLWNEARQIALVLYIIFSFAIFIIIAYLLPKDLYAATIYMTMAGAYFANSLSLVVLFFPKLWRIQKSRKQSRQDDPTGNWDQHSPRRHKLGSGGNVLDGTGRKTGMVPALGRMPGDRALDTASTSLPQVKAADITAAVNAPQKENPSEEASAAAITDQSSQTVQDVINPIRKEKERSEVNAGHRRSNLYPSHASTSGGERQNGNPIDVWMNARIPQETTNTGTLAVRNSGETDAGPNVRGSFMGKHDLQESQMHHPFRHEQGEIEEIQSTDFPRSRDPGALVPPTRGVQFGMTELLKPGMDEQHTSVGAGSSSLPMFLLPIRIEKAKLVNFLSHWSMATIILTPEAHAFLTVESTSVKSNSYLMTSMYQLPTEHKPMLQIETSNNKALLIRFPNQEHLDEWMNLFSAEDLIALGSQHTTTPVGNSSSFDTVVNQTTETLRQRQIPGVGSEQRRPKVSRYDASPTSRAIPRMVDNVVGAKPPGQDLNRSSWIDQLGFSFKRRQRDDGQGMEGDHSQSRAMLSDRAPIQSSDPWSDMSDSIFIIPTPPVRQDNQQHPLILSRDNDPTPIDDDSQIEMDSLRPTVQASTASLAHPETESTADDDHDGDDLYDPEFGIGGGGRRRFLRHSSAMTQPRARTRNGSVTIPSPAVISTAAAAVSVGWSESEALAAATADPSGSFMSGSRNSGPNLSNSNTSNNPTESTSSSGASKLKPKTRGREESLSSLTDLSISAPQSQGRSSANARGNKSTS